MDNKTVVNDYFRMICASWTYGRLNDKERKNLQEAFDRVILSGNYKQRWGCLENIYTGFLAGLGYFDPTISWRDHSEPGRGYQLKTAIERRA